MATKTTPSRKTGPTKAARSTAAGKAPARAPASRKAATKGAGRAEGAASTFRTKLPLANLADGAKNIKQVLRAVERLAKQLAKMDEAGVKLEQPVARNVAMLATSDAKAAKRFGMEEKRGGGARKAAQKGGQGQARGQKSSRGNQSARAQKSARKTDQATEQAAGGNGTAA